MLGKLFFVFSAVLYVNCQLIALPGPSCGCRRPPPPPTLAAPCNCAPPVAPPCACGGQLLAPPPIELLTSLAALSPCNRNVPLATAPCGCNNCKKSPALVSSALAGSVLPTTLAGIIQNAAAPLVLANNCGCNAQNLLVNNCGCNAQNVVLAPRVLQETVVAPRALPELILPAPSTCGCGSCGSPTLPVGGTNPFLPAASPVSAMAPQVVSSILPPVCPCENRAIYLRKIPIPPPSL